MTEQEANIQILHNADGRKALMINGIEIPCVKRCVMMSDRQKYQP